jgi:hypothetical protein
MFVAHRANKLSQSLHWPRHEGIPIWNSSKLSSNFVVGVVDVSMEGLDLGSSIQPDQSRCPGLEKIRPTSQYEGRPMSKTLSLTVHTLIFDDA